MRLSLDFKFRMVSNLQLFLAKIFIGLILHLLLVGVLCNGFQLGLPLLLANLFTFAATKIILMLLSSS